MLTERFISVRNPYTEEVIAELPCDSREDVNVLLADLSSRPALNLSRHERSEIFRRAADSLRSDKRRYALLATSESGLSLKDTEHEVERAANVFELASKLVIIDDTAVFSSDVTQGAPKRKIFAFRRPLALIAAITPFNHPLNQVVHKVVPAVATNNRIVLKPSEKTPLSAFAVRDLLFAAGLPMDAFHVVTGPAHTIGVELVTNPNVSLITFTGSYRVGKEISAQAGYKRRILELGGNDPFIVLDDADLDRAATLALKGSFGNSGQRCTAIKRILVHHDVADLFVQKLTSLVEKLVVGDPANESTDVGTLIDENAACGIERRVSDAIIRGANVVLGHRRERAQYWPTVIDHVPKDCALVAEETFGPVAPIIRIGDLDDAIAHANASAFGLSSAVCTDNWSHITRLASEMRTGALNVWEIPSFRSEHSPFGGIGMSGLGDKEGLVEAMKGYTWVQTISLPWFD